MARRKAHYIKQHQLGGAMWWELSGDRSDNGSIIANVRISRFCTTQSNIRAVLTRLTGR